MSNETNNTFIKITNRNIYDKLCDIEGHVIITNGRVKLNKWIASTALTLVIITIGWLINIT